MTFEFNNPLLYELREDLISKQDLCVISNDSKIVLDELGSEFYGVTAVLVGTAQAGATSTITLTSSASVVDDRYNNFTITITSGTGSGQSKLITDYVGSTKVATISGTWTINPNNTSIYSIACYNESKIITGLSINSFYVNYLNSIITFNSSEIGQTVLASYQGRGIIQIPADRVYTKSVDGSSTETFQQVADSIGNASTVLANLNSSIATGTSTNSTLSSTNSTASATKTDLTNINSTALVTKTDLTAINATATATKNDLGSLNTTALETKVLLDSSNTNGGNTKIALDSSNSTAISTKSNLDNSILSANITRTDLNDMNIIAIATEASLSSANVVASEATRVQNESARIINEGIRVNSEVARVNAENIRKSAEDGRLPAEINRNNAESARIIAENLRIAQNYNTINAENIRLSSEIIRESNEDVRIENEGVRESQEENRQNTYSSGHIKFKGVVTGKTSLPASGNILGDTYQVIDDAITSNNAMWRYNGTIFEKSYVLDLTFAGGYGGNNSQVFTATAGQTVFILTEFPYLIGVNQLMVYVTGIKQIIGVNYTETSTNSFTLTSGVVAGTKVEEFVLVSE